MNATTNTQPNTFKPVKGSYRTKDGKAQIDFELRQKENGPEFSATGEYGGGSGQCLDSIGTAYPDDPTVQRLVKIWERWHLNGLRAGTPEQMEALKAQEEKYPEAEDHEPYKTSYYDWAVCVLRERGLYEVKPGPDVRATGGFPDAVKNGTRGYRYGERWIYEPIPEDVQTEIRQLAEGPKPTEPLHRAQAREFLTRHGLKFRAILSNTKPAPWDTSGDHYRVTISGKGRGRLTFDFWGSVSMMQNGEDLTPYDVLACISSDINTPETFEDFCSEYGEEQDSIKALQTFRRADRFAKRLRNFFTYQEQDALEEIR